MIGPGRPATRRLSTGRGVIHRSRPRDRAPSGVRPSVAPVNRHHAFAIHLHPLVARLRGWPRRLLAASLLVAAGMVAVVTPRHAPGPAPPAASVAVLAAAHDLPAGSLLDPDDVRLVRLPPDTVPAHALTPGTRTSGDRVAGPVRRGEILTDVRLADAGIAARLAGTGQVAVPVRLDDPATALLLRPGSHVDVLAAPSRADLTGASGDGRPASVVASDLTVLAVPSDVSDQSAGALLVVAATEPVARRLAGLAGDDRLSVALRPP